MDKPILSLVDEAQNATAALEILTTNSPGWVNADTWPETAAREHAFDILSSAGLIEVECSALIRRVTVDETHSVSLTYKLAGFTQGAIVDSGPIQIALAKHAAFAGEIPENWTSDATIRKQLKFGRCRTLRIRVTNEGVCLRDALAALRTRPKRLKGLVDTIRDTQSIPTRVKLIQCQREVNRDADRFSDGRMKRTWLKENPELLEKQFEAMRTANQTRVNDAGGGGRGPWQFRKSLCREFGLNCPEFSESAS